MRATVNRDLNCQLSVCFTFLPLVLEFQILRCTYMALILNCGLHFWPWRMRFPEEGGPGSPASVHPVIIQWSRNCLHGGAEMIPCWSASYAEYQWKQGGVGFETIDKWQWPPLFKLSPWLLRLWVDISILRRRFFTPGLQSRVCNKYFQAWIVHEIQIYQQSTCLILEMCLQKENIVKTFGKSGGNALLPVSNGRDQEQVIARKKWKYR